MLPCRLAATVTGRPPGFAHTYRVATRNSRALINIDPGGVCALETSPNAFISIVIEKVLTEIAKLVCHFLLRSNVMMFLKILPLLLVKIWV